MKTILLLFVLIIPSTLLFCQSREPILTKEQNDQWFEELTLSKPDRQLELIKWRILSDTGIYIARSFPDRLTIDRFPKLDSLRKIRVTGYCKPLYLFTFKQKKVNSFYWDNPIKTAQLRVLAELLNTTNVTQIEVLRDEYSIAIYGSRAACGVINIKTDNRKLWRLLKKLNVYDVSGF
jgi:hypothetical protein